MYGNLSRLRGCFSLLVLVWLPCLPVHSWAQPADARSKASALQGSGLRLLNKGDAAGALAKFDEAFALVQSPKILFNKGRAHTALGQFARAYDAFDRFLIEAQDVPPEARGEAERLRSELRARVALIDVSAPTGAAVSVDGTDAGIAPLPRAIVVMPGRHTVSTKTGAAKASETVVDAGAGSHQKVAAPDSATVTPPPVSEPHREAPRRSVPDNVPSTARPSQEGSAPRPSWERPVAWGTGAAAVLALGFGTYELVLSNSRFSEFNESSPNRRTLDGRCTKRNPAVSGDDCQELLDDGERARTISLVGFGTGIALGAMSAYLFYRASITGERSSGGSSAETTLSCAPTSPAQFGATCYVSF